MAEARFTIKENTVTCSICRDVFLKPKMLPCQHTFCSGCLQTCIDGLGNTGSLRNGFPCPYCRKQTQAPAPSIRSSKWAEQFPDNLLAVGMLDDISSNHRENCARQFFCNIDNKLCCSTCATVDHRRCDNIEPIQDVSNRIKRNGEPEKLQTFLSDCIDHVSILNNQLKQTLKGTESEKENALKEIRSIRQKVNTLLDKLETKAIRSLEASHRDIVQPLHHRLTVLEDLQGSMENSQVVLETALSSGSTPEMVHTVISTQQESRELQRRLTDEEDKVVTTYIYKFTVCDQLNTLLNSLSTLGDVEVIHGTPQVPDCPSRKPGHTRGAEKVVDFCGKADGDGETCRQYPAG